MILTDKEIKIIRQSIEEQSGFDEELMRRCRHLLHMESYDEAVRSAFVLLEERLRKAIGEDGMTGTNLAQKAFNPTNGPLSLHLGRTQAEREGLRDLYVGAFKLFRNPTAHGAVGYDTADGKAIIGMVNLMLRMIKRVEELPSPDLFPDNVDAIIGKFETKVGTGEASRLRTFLGKCIKAGIKPSTSAKMEIPFRRYARVHFEQWEKPRAHRIAVFYLMHSGNRFTIFFSTSYYYPSVVGFNLDRLTDSLSEIGFTPEGKIYKNTIDLRFHNDQKFFDNLFEIITRTIKELEELMEE